MLQMFILRRIIHRLPRAHKLLTNIGRMRVFQLNEPNSQTSAASLPPCSSTSAYPLQLTSPQKQQRNKQITFSPEHIFAPKFTPRYTPISRTMSPTHSQPFFRVVPTLVSVATSMQAAQCHLRVRAFAFPPFPPWISPKSTFTNTKWECRIFHFIFPCFPPFPYSSRNLLNFN